MDDGGTVVNQCKSPFTLHLLSTKAHSSDDQWDEGHHGDGPMVVLYSLHGGFHHGSPRVA